MNNDPWKPVSADDRHLAEFMVHQPATISRVLDVDGPHGRTRLWYYKSCGRAYVEVSVFFNTGQPAGSNDPENWVAHDVTDDPDWKARWLALAKLYGWEVRHDCR